MNHSSHNRSIDRVIAVTFMLASALLASHVVARAMEWPYAPSDDRPAWGDIDMTGVYVATAPALNIAPDDGYVRSELVRRLPDGEFVRAASVTARVVFLSDSQLMIECEDRQPSPGGAQIWREHYRVSQGAIELESIEILRFAPRSNQ